MTDYRPVSCQLHSQLELHVMHRQPLQLRWKEASNVDCNLTVLPLDLYTRDGREFLQIRDEHGQTRAIRLDRIISFSTVD